VAATATAVSGVVLPQPTREAAGEQMESVVTGGPRLAKLAAAELAEYFAGQRREFSVPVDLSGLPSFTQRVLAACATIPWGTTQAYGQLAAEVGSPQAARAVGQALGRNPVPILVPCHRVICADGSLGGFGAGLMMKRRLLELEGLAL